MKRLGFRVEGLGFLRLGAGARMVRDLLLQCPVAVADKFSCCMIPQKRLKTMREKMLGATHWKP